MNEFLAIVIIMLGVGLVCIGLAIYYYIKMKRVTRPVGSLRVDTSDPDGPYLFLELYTDVDRVCRKKSVVLEVNMSNYISQK